MKYKFIEIEIANFCEEFVKAILNERPKVEIHDEIKDPDYRKVLREISGEASDEEEKDSELLNESEIRLLPTFVETIRLKDIRTIAEIEIHHPEDADYTLTMLYPCRSLYARINYEKFRDILNEYGGGVITLE